MSDCARCEDDSVVREYRGGVADAVKVCVVCGAPAKVFYKGKWYCQKHYVQALAQPVKTSP